MIKYVFQSIKQINYCDRIMRLKNLSKIIQLWVYKLNVVLPMNIPKYCKLSLV